MKINEKIGLGCVMPGSPQFLRKLSLDPEFRGRWRQTFKKCYLVMKLTIFIITVCLLQVSAASVAQITIRESSAPLTKILDQISSQSGYDMVYSVADLKDIKPMRLVLDNVSLEKALEACFSGQPLIYEVSDRTVMIRAKEDKGVFSRIIDRLNAFEASGRVVDAEGKPLPGATIRVKNGKGSTLADANGRFSLGKVEEGMVLVISYTGYITKEVTASANMGNIVLELSLSKLDEVQVIAYGTTTQRLSTGNVTTIKADVIEKQPVNNPLLALQGRVPGLFIEQATGFAGTGVKVRIQGQNSLNNGSDPLYVIDGVPFISQSWSTGNLVLGTAGGTGDNVSSVGSPLSFINPSDIESIDVLKDADATAIYGSRAANGAILITTKKGKAGDTKVNLNLQSGWSKVPNKLNLMSSEQYLEMRREALKNDGMLTYSNGDNDLNGNWDNSRYTDWQKDLIGGTAGYQDLNASVSGGNDRTVFLIGTGYHRETTVFPGDYSDRKASLHFSINNTSANQKFQIQLSGSYLYDYNQLPNKDLTADATRLAPIAPSLFKPDGSINWQPNAVGSSTFIGNPIGFMFNKYLDKTSALTSNMLLSYQILPGLDFKSNFGYNTLVTKTIDKSLLQSVYPEIAQYFSRSTSFGNNSLNSWLIEPQFSYRTNINKGNLEVLLGATIQQRKSTEYQIVASGFSNDLVMEDMLSATNINVGVSNSALYKYNALFGRVNYNFEDKYIINLTGRRDGSSRFGPSSQFHNFAALGAAWIFSNEKIIKDYFNFISFGKIRGSYGTTGSDQIGEYQFLSLFDPLSQQIPYQGLPVYQPKRLTNYYLEWEETRKLQFGLDLGFIKDRLLLNANYYVNRSSNQLNNFSLPFTTGFASITKNQNFKIQNSGWELMLSSTNIQTGSVNWKTSVNITVPKTLLVDYPDIDKPYYEAIGLIKGKPLSAIRVNHFLGVDPATGVYQFADKNGNPTFTPTEEDKTVILDGAPKFYGGIRNSFSYKGIELGILFSFTKQIARNYLFSDIGTPGIFSSGKGNQTEFTLNRWQKPGDIAPVQRYTTGYDLYQSQNNINYNSDAAWADASYIRLKNVSLSWQLPKSWITSSHLRQCDLFIQGQNLWTLTNYTGLDPETRSSITLPPLRTITIGIKAGL